MYFFQKGVFKNGRHGWVSSVPCEFSFDGEIINKISLDYGHCEACGKIGYLTFVKYEDGNGDDHELFMCGDCRDCKGGN